MNIEKNLILLKGQDCTKDILNWKYEKGNYIITFNEGSIYKYAYSSVEFFKDPEELNLNYCYIMKIDRQITDVVR